jgi:hypothetical protein
VTASIGVVPTGGSADLLDLLRRADQAMFSAKRHACTIGKVGITWVVATESGDHTDTYETADAPAIRPAETASPPAVACRPGDPVWVHRNGARRAGVVEGTCGWAALVRYRCPNGAGTMVDTMPTACLTIRAERDPHLDRESSAHQ